MKIYLFCESFNLGGVQSFYLRLAKAYYGKFILVSLTNIYDIQFLNDLKRADISYLFASDLFTIPVKLKRATHLNLIPINRIKVLNNLPENVLNIHVSSLSGAVFASRLSKYKNVKLNIGIYNSLIFGWKGDYNSYYELLSSAILDGFFGKDSVLFTNEQSKKHYQKLLGKELNGKLMPVGVEECKKVLRFPKSNNTKKFTVVTVGRLIEYKTYNEHLINVLNKITKNNDHNIVLSIYGTGNYIHKLKALAKDANFEVEFHGNVNYSNLHKVFESADCFVGCGTTLVEAASYGLPCIIGIEGIKQPETYGFFSSTTGYSFHEPGLNYSLVSIESCLEKLLNHTPEECRLLSLEHVKRAADFSLDVSYEKMIENFERQDYLNISELQLNLPKLNISIVYEQIMSLIRPSSSYNNRY